VSRRRKLSRRRVVLGIVHSLDLRCPVDESHSLATIKVDVGGVKLWPAVDKSETVVGPPEVPIYRDGTRLRWTCPACRHAGRYEDRQVRWDRIEALSAAMSNSRQSEYLRVRLDPDELSRHTQRLRVHALAQRPDRYSGR
jgi:hypothetical protein